MASEGTISTRESVFHVENFVIHFLDNTPYVPLRQMQTMPDPLQGFAPALLSNQTGNMTGKKYSYLVFVLDL